MTQLQLKMQEQERLCTHGLILLPGMGRRTILQLTNALGSARAVYEQPWERLEELLPEKMRGEKLETAFRCGPPLKDYRRMGEMNIRCIPYGDPLFPERLRKIPDPPAALYVKGDLPGEDCPAAALIGARNCTEYGRHIAGIFAEELALAGINIISGMALGIDGICQERALDMGGRSYALAGCGVDICYPPENRRLYERLAQKGGIISEYPPGTAPKPGFFPQRNRLISGLSDVLLVVEARKKSGTMITVDQALEQGKEVCVIPGRLTDPLSEGTNFLLSQGARPVFCPEELARLITDLPLRNMAVCGQQEMEASPDLKELVAQALDFMPQSAAAIADRLRVESVGQLEVGLPQVTRLLFDLLLEGRCGQEGSYFYKKIR